MPVAKPLESLLELPPLTTPEESAHKGAENVETVHRIDNEECAPIDDPTDMPIMESNYVLDPIIEAKPILSTILTPQ